MVKDLHKSILTPQSKNSITRLTLMCRLMNVLLVFFLVCVCRSCECRHSTTWYVVLKPILCTAVQCSVVYSKPVRSSSGVAPAPRWQCCQVGLTNCQFHQSESSPMNHVTTARPTKPQITQSD